MYGGGRFYRLTDCHPLEEVRRNGVLLIFKKTLERGPRVDLECGR